MKVSALVFRMGGSEVSVDELMNRGHCIGYSPDQNVETRSEQVALEKAWHGYQNNQLSGSKKVNIRINRIVLSGSINNHYELTEGMEWKGREGKGLEPSPLF